MLYQLLLLTEAPHRVAALKQLSFRSRWLHLHPLNIRRPLPGLDYWINSEYCCIQIHDLFFALEVDICALFRPYTQEFQGYGVKLS